MRSYPGCIAASLTPESAILTSHGNAFTPLGCNYQSMLPALSQPIPPLFRKRQKRSTRGTLSSFECVQGCVASMSTDVAFDRPQTA